MGKAKDLFKKIGDTRGASHEKMDSLKDKNSKDLTEEEEMTRIHRRIIQRKKI